MKIAIIIPQIGKYSETWIADQIEYLEEYIILIIVKSRTSIKEYKGIKVISLNPFPSFFEKSINKIGIKTDRELSVYENVLKELKINNIEALYIHFLDTAYILKQLLNKIKLPIFVHCHGYDVTWDLRLHNSPETKYHDSSYISFLRKWSNRLIFIANSNFTKKKLISIGIPKESINVCYFGVKVPINLSIKPQPSSKIKILYVSRLVDCKGPDLLIKAFELAVEKGLRGDLYIVGDGNLEVTCHLLKSRSKFKNHIHLLGVRNKTEVLELLKNVDIFSMHNNKGVLSRQEEAFGVSIIEAMSLGLPVITGRSGGVVETIIDGITGFLVDPGDTQSHADKLLELYKNKQLRIDMGRMGYQHVKEGFNKEKEIHNILSLLEEKISQKN